MAIHNPDEPAEASPQQQAVPTQPIDIEAWTEQATAALSSVTISAVPGETVQTARVTLSIPLDEHPAPQQPRAAATVAKEGGGSASLYKRKEPVRRDSMKRREALLKGKEGSRRRQRWENDHLLSNPYVEAPTSKDWEIHPTYKVHHVPYYLAPLWDAGLARQSAERKSAASKAKSSTRTTAGNPTDAGVIPRELREKLKKARGAKGLLMDLECEVRKFVASWEEKERRAEADGIPADPDSSDDEIVFVGRNGQMNDLRSPNGGDDIDIKREMMLFETPVNDQGGTFGRWLVHHIGTYYGLKTWSVTRGDPARREAYIGIKDAKMRPGGGGRRKSICSPMPRPLYGLV